jgi:DMSO/TMAO reductase YedYZ molybdopterin-dependent catalytic subunit
MTATKRARVRIRDVWPGSSAPSGTLPPGQRLIHVFPRYGTHLSRPIPDVSQLSVIKVTGAVTQPVDIPIADLASMSRREMRADFHCVAGWSVQGLRWEGVPFRSLYEAVIEPVARPGVSHLLFAGVDGFWAVLTIEDALNDDVMVADHLDGVPLRGYHGGPARLVSPSQYGYKSTKHLSAIELHTAEPSDGHADLVVNLGLRLVKAHPRARVAAEERHRYLPPWAVRWLNFNLIHPVAGYLSELGARPTSSSGHGRQDEL